MTDCLVPMKTALQVTKENRFSRVPVRGSENRLEPECWPGLTPGFTFGRQDGVFVIGSCFATNIENYLDARGYDMLSRKLLRGTGVTPGHMNKYTPASILQEVAWAREILERDDEMSEADARRLFFTCEDGRVIDTQLHPFEPRPLEEALERRRAVYRTWRALFSADVVVITLGLTEAWWDAELQLYITETPTRPMQRAGERFFFQRLGFARCMEMMRSAVALIRGERDPRILITTSPVVLARTYTPEDVLVANSHSKSVLRAVAGELAQDTPGVEYFPSYESVMLTRSASVWQDDLKHVSEQFVHRIMSRVEQSYTAEGAATNLTRQDLEGRFAEAVEAHDLAGAAEIYRDMPEPLAHPARGFHTLAAVVAAAQGDAALARAHLEADAGNAGVRGLNQLAFLRYSAWKQVGAPERADAWLAEELGGGGKLRGFVVHKSTRWLFTEGRARDAVEILERVDPSRIAMVQLLNRFAEQLNRHGRPELAERYLAAVPEGERITLKRPKPRSSGWLSRLGLSR
ncbi:GSCFA domain-containing protein [Oceanicella sp. SM1341]|uniref:GSCFA domain-containing protein n=1 Tax=Oceanicella sp. SM1341 TaxID=1548889 RepID=UPI0013007AB5|nr:GSCFA domain-containing protein [Oceanicella sp. SM1341]